MFCRYQTRAQKRYQAAVLRWMTAYVVVLFCSSWFVRHDGAERFFLYFWSVLPAIPIIGVIWRVGIYLREETDEYQRWLRMQSILVGTGALLATVVISDFLQAFAHTTLFAPFWQFTIFALATGITGWTQRLRNRTVDDEKSSA